MSSRLQITVATMVEVVVFRRHILWEFALALGVIMAFPAYVAWSLTHEPEVLVYYSKPSQQLNIRRTVFLSLSSLALLLVVLAIVLWLALRNRLAYVTNGARPAAARVLEAYYLSRITGAYWENVMQEEAAGVKKLPQKDRITYYESVLLNCDLDTSRMTVFVELLGADADALRKSLTTLRHSQRFGRLNTRQQKEVKLWEAELAVIVE
ncbi:MAG: hypothetical protein WCN95_10810 [bacterium]